MRVHCVKCYLQLSVKLKNVLIWTLDSYACKMPMFVVRTLRSNTQSKKGKMQHAKQALYVGTGTHTQSRCAGGQSKPRLGRITPERHWLSTVQEVAWHSGTFWIGKTSEIISYSDIMW
jgi:hypothetical protein